MTPEEVGGRMSPTAQPEPATGLRWLWRTAAIFGALSLLNLWQLLIGRVPFPADGILGGNLWATVRVPWLRFFVSHAELGDLVSQTYPWHAYAGAALHRGVLPFWTPHIACGMPFLAHPTVSVFYPPNLLYAVLSAPLAWSLAFWAEPVLAGLWMTLFVRSLGASESAALASGISFAFCGQLVAWQGWANADAALWLPLVFFAVDRLRGSGKGRDVALLGLAFALTAIAGHPEIAAQVVLAGIVYASFRLFAPLRGREAASRMRFVLLVAGSSGLALALGAVQIVPSLGWLSLVGRTLQARFAPIPLHEILAVVSRDLGARRVFGDIFIPPSAAYTGVVGLLAAPFAFRASRREAAFFLGLVAGTLPLAYGVGPLFPLIRRLPVLGELPPSVFLISAEFGVAVLAGLGLSALAAPPPAGQNPRVLPKRDLALLSGMLVVLSVLLFLLVRHGGGDPPTRWWRGPGSAAGFLVAGAVWLCPGVRRRARPGWWGRGALALVALDMMSFAYGAMPFWPRRALYPEPSAYAYLRKKDSSLFRIAVLDTWPDNVNMLYGLASPTAYTIPLRRMTALLSGLSGRGTRSFSAANVLRERDSRRIDLLNVKYLLTVTEADGAAIAAASDGRFPLIWKEGAVRIFENPGALPRFFCVPADGIEIAAGEDVALRRVRSRLFDPASRVVLLERPAVPAPGERPPAQNRIEDVKTDLNEAALRVRLSRPAILVWSDQFADGWHVELDGKADRVLRADYAFKAVALPSGEHSVRFWYRPPGFGIAVAISLAALAVTAALCAFAR